MEGVKDKKGEKEEMRPPSPSGPSGSSATHIKPRKHKRIRRACDDCRSRKIKCDGKSLCLSCEEGGRGESSALLISTLSWIQQTLIDTECTYNLKLKRRHLPPLYVEELENKLKGLEGESQALKSILLSIFPEVDLEDPEAKTIIERKILEGRQRAEKTQRKEGAVTPSRATKTPESIPNTEELLETMVEATGRLEIDSQGHHEYHGDFAGLAFLDQIGERCSQLLGTNLSTQGYFSHSSLGKAFGSARLSLVGLNANSMNMFHLPPRPIAERLTSIALNDALSLMNVIHLPTFNGLLAQIYSVNPGSYSSVEESFLPLLYVTLAIGELFDGDLPSQEGPMSSLENMKG